MATLVPTVKTAYTKEEFVKSLIQAWQELFSETPSKQSIAIIVAQHGVETGDKSSYCWNNNICNVKANLKDDVEYCFLNNTWEIIGGKKVIFIPPHPACAFRSFRTLLDGVKFQLDLLKNKRYKSSWQYVISGDPVAFVKALKDARYFTASLESYTKNMKFFFDKFMKDSIFEKVVFDLQEEQLKALPTFIFPLNIEDSFTNKTIEVDRRTYFASPEFRKGKKSDPEVTVKSTALTKQYTNPFVKLFLIVLNFFKNLTKKI
jgi:hypothetical protein